MTFKDKNLQMAFDNGVDAATSLQNFIDTNFGHDTKAHSAERMQFIAGFYICLSGMISCEVGDLQLAVMATSILSTAKERCIAQQKMKAH